MPNPTPLSPAAQAVLDAYGHEVGGTAAITSYERHGIAAALRAAADQVVPVQEPLGLRASRDECLAGVIRSAIRHHLLAIAAELEGSA